MLQYLRLALRALRRTPTFTATAVLTLGVAIGMASAMFTVFHAVVVRRLPVQDLLDRPRASMRWWRCGVSRGRGSGVWGQGLSRVFGLENAQPQSGPGP